MIRPFVLNDNLIAGPGISLLPEEYLGEFDCSRVVLLVDQGVRNHSEYFAEFLDAVNNYDDLDLIHIQALTTTKEPEYEYLEEVLAEVRELPVPSLLIGVGGGSALDITKAVAALLNNPGPAVGYRGFDKLTNRGVPTVCIPSTAGTGSEVTYNASFVDQSIGQKMGINGHHMTASRGVLDAKWIVSCPYPVALSTGLDAMTHCLESFTCRQSTIMSRIVSRAAFPMIWRSLSRLRESDYDLALTQQLLVGAHLAAASLMNSGSGIASALSYPLSVHHGVPHGVGGGMFLASVVEFNISAGYNGYGELIQHVVLDHSESDPMVSLRFLESFRTLMQYLEVPQTLVQWGITRANIEDVASLMLPMQTAFDQNPIPFDALNDSLAILSKHVD